MGFSGRLKEDARKLFQRISNFTSLVAETSGDIFAVTT